MADFAGVPGHMKDWDFVEEIEGAFELLAKLSKVSDIYVATSADTTPENIEAALNRVGLGQFVKGYFCPCIIGCAKPDPKFYTGIASHIGVQAKDITMVGDSLVKDILPSLKVGMQAIWLNTKKIATTETGINEVSALNQVHT